MSVAVRNGLGMYASRRFLVLLVGLLAGLTDRQRS